MNSDFPGLVNRVGVYGTLKQGQRNHYLLAESRFVGRCRVSHLILYDIGPYPGAKLRPGGDIEVEIYDVGKDVFDRLDELEDYDAVAPNAGEYNRLQLETPFGLAWIYLYNPDVDGLPEIRAGSWPAIAGSLSPRDPA